MLDLRKINLLSRQSEVKPTRAPLVSEHYIRKRGKLFLFRAVHVDNQTWSSDPSPPRDKPRFVPSRPGGCPPISLQPGESAAILTADTAAGKVSVAEVSDLDAVHPSVSSSQKQ